MNYYIIDQIFNNPKNNPNKRPPNYGYIFEYL